MPFSLRQTTPPANEPLSAQEAIDGLRLWGSDPPSVMERLIKAARRKVEIDSGRQLLPATWLYTLDSFPYQWNTDRQTQLFINRDMGRNTFALQQGIQLPRPPLRAITQIQFVGTTGVLTTIDAGTYQVDTQSEPGRVAPGYGLVWPIALLEPNAVQITYTAGYDDASKVPENLKLALLMLVGHWYRFRAATSDTPPSAVPMGYQDLIEMERVRIFW